MLDDFFVRALLAGVGVALIAGPLGCFIVWRRLAYFGDTLAHAASLANDSLLGLMSHGSLALGLVVLAFMTSVRIDLLALLFGDILAVSKLDLVLIYAGGLTTLVVLLLIWKKLFAATVNRELAAAEGMNPELVNFIFMLLVATVIAIAMKVVGVMLITALLIIPAAAARRLSTTPEFMALLASIFGVLSVLMGLNASLQFDTPSGPSIVVASLVVFLVCFAIPKGK